MLDWTDGELLASVKFVKKVGKHGAEEHEDEGERAQPSAANVAICCCVFLEESHKYCITIYYYPQMLQETNFFSNQCRKKWKIMCFLECSKNNMEPKLCNSCPLMSFH